ncbi:MAG TPA: SDR family NAD(P)-dependent oxidoreductase [Caulobacteraceae bacterium]|jgi:NAD(P)-dependent dehydrogenase (short-subunit alcohol dehydrogenase family)|nr:SDR family NAD(P)-dependent oxidoreductase [Caulobacteraceae bacterium]
MGVLDGKVVLVTGGGNGIGRECALIAAREGAKVLVNDLGGGERGGDEGSSGPAETVAAEIRAAGGVAVANSKSVTDMGAVKDMVQQAIDELGGLHSVINPAGILRDGMFHKMADEDWDVVVAVHLRGSYNVCRATIEHFRNQNEGSYVLFTSTSGLIGNIGQTNYAAAKLGIMGLSRVLAMEGASKNVRSNIIAPTAWTRLIATIPVKDEAGSARMEAMKQALRPDQPAKLAVALASPAASHVTGQIFGARSETLELFSQPRPVETVTSPDTWTVETILSEALPKMAPKFTSLGGPGQQQQQQRQPA